MQRARHLTVPELTCESCQALAKEIETVREMLRTMALENNRLMEERAGAVERDRIQGNEIARLKRDQTLKARKADRSALIEEVIAHWRAQGRKTNFPPGGRNWATIDKALSLMEKDDAGPVKACCEAITGLHLAPFQHFDKRYATPGNGRELRRDVEHALGDEVRIARCRLIAQKARNMMLTDALLMYEVTGSAHDAWARMYLDLIELRSGVTEVDGIVTK
jgi:hypothetical protein